MSTKSNKLWRLAITNRAAVVCANNRGSFQVAFYEPFDNLTYILPSAWGRCAARHVHASPGRYEAMCEAMRSVPRLGVAWPHCLSTARTVPAIERPCVAKRLRCPVWATSMADKFLIKN